MSAVGEDKNQPEPVEVASVWRLLDVHYDDPDELGVMSMHFHVLNVTSGKMFLLSLSGDGTASSRDFVNACIVVSRTIDRADQAATETKEEDSNHEH